MVFWLGNTLQLKEELLVPVSPSPLALELLCSPAGADSTLISSRAEGPIHSRLLENLYRIDLL